MKKIIKYIIVIGIGLVIAFLIALSKDVFNVTDKKTIYHILSDSFMVPGVITAGMGLLIYVSDQGVFDGIVYGIMAFMNMFSPRNERKYNSLYEYKEKKVNILDCITGSMGIMMHELYNYEIEGIEYLLKIDTKDVWLLEIEKMEIELSMPKELCYLEGQDFDDYMHDMHIAQEYAKANRFEIAKRILAYLGLKLEDLFHFETVHNYINMKDKILRKGAISAYKDETVLIPINMKDGCIVAKGKSNKKYNYSAPHGAGRLISRNKAKKTLSLEEYQKSMEGIYSTTVNQKTLDEAPMAYKPIESIINNIKDTILKNIKGTVDIIEIIKPIYNFKADE